MADIVGQVAQQYGVPREYAQMMLDSALTQVARGDLKGLTKDALAPDFETYNMMNDALTGNLGTNKEFNGLDVLDAAIAYGREKGTLAKDKAIEAQGIVDKARENYGAMSGLLPGEEVAVSTNNGKLGGLNDQKVIDVILGEAIGVGVKGREASYKDMVAIASVIANRSNALGVSPREVVGKKAEFNARGPSRGMDKYRDLAVKAVEQVMQSGPVHKATFYATPGAKGNLPKGLQRETATAGHVFFSDPQNRAIRTSAGWRNPNPAAIAASTAPARASQSVRDIQQQLAELGVPISVDGKMGPKTRAEIVAFQRAADGLVPDGVPGKQTREALARAVSAVREPTVTAYNQYANRQQPATVTDPAFDRQNVQLANMQLAPKQQQAPLDYDAEKARVESMFANPPVGAFTAGTVGNLGGITVTDGRMRASPESVLSPFDIGAAAKVNTAAMFGGMLASPTEVAAAQSRMQERQRQAQIADAARAREAQAARAAPAPVAAAAPAPAPDSYLSLGQVGDPNKPFSAGVMQPAPPAAPAILSAAPASDFRAAPPAVDYAKGKTSPTMAEVQAQFAAGPKDQARLAPRQGIYEKPATSASIAAAPPAIMSAVPTSDFRATPAQQTLMAAPVGPAPAPRDMVAPQPAEKYAGVTLAGMPAGPMSPPVAAPVNYTGAAPKDVQTSRLDQAIQEMTDSLPPDAVTDGSKARPGVQIGEMMRGLPGTIVGGLLGSAVMGPVGGILGAALGRGVNGGQLGGMLGGLLGGGERSAPQGMIDIATPSSGGFRSIDAATKGEFYTNPAGVRTQFTPEGATVGGPGNSGK